MVSINDNLFIQDENHLIYKYDINNISYYLCIPSNKYDSYQMFVAFPTKNINGLDKDEISNLINNVNTTTSSISKNSILVIPCIDYSLLEEAAHENDHRLYVRLFNKIHEITNNVYKKIVKENSKLEQVIIFIKQNSNDSKFIDWLEINMNGFIKGMNFNNNLSYQFEDNSSLGIDDTLQDDDWTTYGSRGGIGSTNNEKTISNSNIKTKKLAPPKKRSSGFSTFTFITLVLTISTLLGIGIGYLLIK